MTLLEVGGRPADTRVATGLITGAELADVWPEVSTRLGKLLTSRGAARDVADDVVQEVAARALAHGIVFIDAGDLMRWAVPVALNLLVDHARAAGRVTVGIDDYDAAEGDVADLVAHRDRLRQVLGAVARLSDADRAALAPEVESPLDRREAVKLAVRRHRARRRLLALVDGVAGLVAWIGVQGRMWGRRSRAGVVLVPVAFILPAALVLVSPAGPDTRGEPVTLPPAEAVAPAVSTSVETTVVKVVRAVASAPRPTIPPVPPGVTKPPTEPRDVVAVGPKGNRVRLGNRPATEDDHLFCLHVEVPGIGEPCVG